MRLHLQIWGLSCPSKIKIAVWKFLKNFVPTRMCLYNKRVTSDIYCPRCLTVAEDVSHVLCFCEFARFVWTTFL